VFWDSSALVPLLLREERSTRLLTLLDEDLEPVIWWCSPVECASALYRRRREGQLASETLRGALQRLDALDTTAETMLPSDNVRLRAQRILATHPLRAADALQLAAALVWSDERPQGESFVCLDERLRQAARQEGFSILP
jgi:predicted nucleic acid-binding protein